MCESILPTKDCCHDHSYVKLLCKPLMVMKVNYIFIVLDEVGEVTVMQLANGIQVIINLVTQNMQIVRS